MLIAQVMNPMAQIEQRYRKPALVKVRTGDTVCPQAVPLRITITDELMGLLSELVGKEAITQF